MPKGPKRKFTAQQVEYMVDAYNNGESTEKIGKELSCSATTIARYLIEQGVGLRAAGFQRGEAHHAWKGGRIITEDGYALALVYPDDPFYKMGQIKSDSVGRYVLEHRLVMARHLGRALTEDETVHHIDDGDRQNNSISNLQLRRGNHGKGAALRCSDCGSCNIVAVELS